MKEALENECEWNGPLTDERLVPFENDEISRKLFEASRTDKSRKISVSEAIRRRVFHAIVLIHNEARYFEGMSILCAIAGMKPRTLENGFDSTEEQLKTRRQFNNWIKKIAGD